MKHKVLLTGAAGFILLGCAAAGQSAPAPAAAAAAAAAGGGAPAPVAATSPTQAAVATEVPGEATTTRLCTQCHTLESATAQRHTRDEWNEVIGRMINQGLVASDDELYEVSDYLTENYGPPAT